MSSPSITRGSSTPAVAPQERVEAFLMDNARLVGSALEQILPAAGADDGKVAEAMRYTALAPGKRIRPVILLAVAECYSAPRHRLLQAACAVEMIHAASLILDDLPCMDDAQLRRDRPANHRVYGESTAILAAFGLLNLAYRVVAGDAALPEETRAEVAIRLGDAVGTRGLIGGQALDLALDASRLTLDELERIHSRKTGCLFIASVEIGAILGKAPVVEREALCGFAKNLGLAYQIVDDLLDATGDAASTGKPTQADHRGNFVSISGVEGARRLAAELSDCALEHLAVLGPGAALLRGLAWQLTARAR